MTAVDNNGARIGTSSQSFLEEIEKGFREMQGAPKDAAPQDGLSGEAAPRADAPKDAASTDDDAKGDEDKR